MNGHSFKNDGGVIYEMLSWDEEETQPPVSDEMREIFTTIFGKREVWEVVKRSKKVSLVRSGDAPKTLSAIEKKMFLKVVCDNKYSEDELIFIRVYDDFSAGWALTKDSFCVSDSINIYHNGRDVKQIFYKDFAEGLYLINYCEFGHLPESPNLLENETVQQIMKFLYFVKS